MLMVNHLIGFGAGGNAAVLSFQQAVSSGVDSSTYTFSSVAFGAAHPSRVVYWAGGGIGNGALRTVSSVTIGGVTATVMHSSTVGTSRVDIYAALVPTGTTGDIVVTYSGTMFNCGGAVWSAVDAIAGTTAFHTAATTTDAASININVDTLGYAIGVSFANGGTSCTWTGLTEESDTLIEAGNNVSTAAYRNLGGAVTVAVTADQAGTIAEYVCALASFR